MNQTFSEISSTLHLPRRLRRNRSSEAIRGLVQETHLTPGQLVAPFFVIEGKQIEESIPSMPGVHRLSVDLLIEKCRFLWSLGIRSVDLFSYVPETLKTAEGSEALNPDNLISRAIQEVKSALPDLCIMADIALDPYTTHGHDGVLGSNQTIDNDQTLPILAQMSLLAAKSGADLVAPSDMMDGRVAMIRSLLDEEGYQQVGILSYAAKYASAFYGPFRDALGSAPKIGDKKTYQLNPANIREALLEAELDEEEGADMLMVKPALAYLDVLALIRQRTHLPICAYHVSGEYAMTMAAAEKGWLDADRIFMESLMCIKRAGADFILTYAAERVAKQLNA